MFFSTTARPLASCCQLCFPRGETWFSPCSAGAAGKGRRACQLLDGTGGLGHGCSCPLLVWGPIPLPTRTSDSHEGESCQVTCRGQHVPEAPASHLTQEAGRVLSAADGQGAVTSWPGPGSAPAVASNWLKLSCPPILGSGLRRGPPCWTPPLPASPWGPQS